MAALKSFFFEVTASASEKGRDVVIGLVQQIAVGLNGPLDFAIAVGRCCSSHQFFELAIQKGAWTLSIEVSGEDWSTWIDKPVSDD